MAGISSSPVDPRGRIISIGSMWSRAKLQTSSWAILLAGGRRYHPTRITLPSCAGNTHPAPSGFCISIRLAGMLIPFFQAVELTREPMSLRTNASPDWLLLSDHNEIAFSFSRSDSKSRHIYSVEWSVSNPRGNDPEFVIFNGEQHTEGEYNDDQPSWSPDGRWIAFTASASRCF